MLPLHDAPDVVPAVVRMNSVRLDRAFVAFAAGRTRVREREPPAFADGGYGAIDRDPKRGVSPRLRVARCYDCRRIGVLERNTRFEHGQDVFEGVIRRTAAVRASGHWPFGLRQTGSTSRRWSASFPKSRESGRTCLNIELDYRAEHVDETVLGNLVNLLHTVAEQQYPRIFRIVNGDDVLESLGRSLETGIASRPEPTESPTSAEQV